MTPAKVTERSLLPRSVFVAVVAVCLLVPWHWTVLTALALVLFCAATLVTTLLLLCWRHLAAADQLQLHVLRSCWPPPATSLPQLSAVAGAGGAADSWERHVDWRYTGSSVVDHQLHQLLQLALRDYVLSWHQHVAPGDRRFIGAIHALIRTFIVNVAARAKEVDWVPFITGRVVDIVVQHLRLYRQARAAVAMSGVGENSRPAETVASHGYTPVSGAQASTTDCEAIEAHFFQLEASDGGGGLSRRGACTDDKRRRQYVRDMARMILHKFLPEKEMACPPVQTVAVEVTSQLLLLPLFELLSSADFANRLVLSCCSLAASRGVASGGEPSGSGGTSNNGGVGNMITTDALRAVLRFCWCCEELHAVRKTVAAEMTLLRSRDTGGQQNDEVKDQMSSLSYVDRLIASRLQVLESRRGSAASVTPSDSRCGPAVTSAAIGPGDPLPLEILLRNNVGLSYFLDFLADSAEQHLLFFYLNSEAWRLVAEEQLLGRPRQQDADEEELRHSAQYVFDQALSASAPIQLPLDARLVQKLASCIRHERPVSVTWFDEARAAVVELLSADRFYPAFQRTLGYRRLLAELEIWRDGEEDDTASTPTTCNDDRSTGASQTSSPSPQPVSASTLEELVASVRQVRRVDADVIVSGVACDAGRCYTLYSVVVTVLRSTSTYGTRATGSASNERTVWTVQRRYSDFYQFRERTIARYPWLARITFPGKRAFNNQSPSFVERRRAALASFLAALLEQSLLAQHDTLWQMVLSFLMGRRGAVPGGLGRAVTSAVVAPLRESWRAVGDAADKLQQTAGDMVGGLNRAIRGPDSATASMLQQQRHVLPPSPPPPLLPRALEADDSPLRIVLLLLEEVFDLRTQHQWLRRYMLAILRNLMRAMYGDVVTRRIVDCLADLTRPDRVAGYVRLLRQTLWPSGSAAAAVAATRDVDTCLRARFVARAALLASVGDDVKHLVGAETARRGVFLICDLLQSAPLNFRLVLVLFEALIELLLPKCDVARYVALVHAKKCGTDDSATSSASASADSRRG